MPDVSVEPEKVRALSDAVKGRVLTTLSETNEILPKLREIDQDLYTSVNPALAVAYTAGTSYMYSAVRGAAECFEGLSAALAASADDWEKADEDIAGPGSGGMNAGGEPSSDSTPLEPES